MNCNVSDLPIRQGSVLCSNSRKHISIGIFPQETHHLRSVLPTKAWWTSSQALLVSEYFCLSFWLGFGEISRQANDFNPFGGLEVSRSCFVDAKRGERVVGLCLSRLAEKETCSVRLAGNSKAQLLCIKESLWGKMRVFRQQSIQNHSALLYCMIEVSFSRCLGGPREDDERVKKAKS